MKKLLTLLVLPAMLLCACSEKTIDPTTVYTRPSEVTEELSEETTTAEETTTETTDITEPTETTEATTTVSEEMLPLSERIAALDNPTADDILAIMTTEEKIMQLFIVTPEQLIGDDKTAYVTKSSDALTAALEKYPVAGVVMFDGNIIAPDQTIALNSEFTSRYMFVCVDEEGGEIVRIADNTAFQVTWYTPDYPNDDPYLIYSYIARYVKDYGFNVDFAPVADIEFTDSSFMKGRCFGSDSDSVGECVMRSVQAFNEQGVICSLKHFPGHGDIVADSHNGSVVLDKSMMELLDNEFVPFFDGSWSGAPMIMVGHIIVPTVTGDLPSSLSSDMMDELRQTLNFNGIIITDSFWMKAITDNYTADEAASMAILAGADIVLMPDDLDLAIEGVQKIVDDGTLPEWKLDAKVRRIIEAKLEYGII